MNLKCPYAIIKLVGDEIYATCDLVDERCLLEDGYECKEYEEFLREVEE